MSNFLKPFLLNVLILLFSLVSINTSAQKRVSGGLSANSHSQTTPSEEIDLDKKATSLKAEPEQQFSFEIPESFSGKKELLHKRDMTSKHFLNADGTLTAILAAGPLHYEENGKWLDINHRITATNNADYSYANTTNLLKSYFGAYSNIGVKNVAAGAEVKEFLNVKMYWEVSGQSLTVSNAANVPLSVNGDKAYYNNLFGNINAEFTVESGRRKLNYIIPHLQALNNITSGADFLVFSEEVQLPQGWTYALDNEKGILLKNEKGNAVYAYENPISTDAAEGIERAENTLMEARLSGNTLTILTKVKTSWLLDNNRQFPVKVDPTVNVFPDNNFTGQANAAGGGAYGTIAFGYSGQFFRGYATFNTTSIPVGSTINQTVLNHNCAATVGMLTARGSELRAFLADPDDCLTWACVYNSIVDVNISPNIYQTAYHFNSTGWKSITLGATANTHLANRISIGNFTIGYRPAGTYSGANQYATVHGFNQGVNRPYLAIDYTVPSACFPGTASGPGYVPTNGTANLTLSGYTGSSIQWQSSPNGTTGWTNVSTGTGGTTDNYTTAALANGNYYFRAEVKEGACTDYSNVVSFYVAASPVYCSGAGSGNAVLNNHLESIVFHEWIDPTVGGTNNFVSNNYLNYTDTTTYGYATVVAGQYHHLGAVLRAQGSGTNSTTFSYWIDWNGDGTFNNTLFSSGGERMDNINYTSTSSNSYASYFSVPTSANGMVRVRMRVVRGNVGALDPCTAYSSSQTKDFMVKILPSIGSQVCGAVNGTANTVLTNNTTDKVNISRVKVNGSSGTVLNVGGGAGFFGVQAGTNITMYNYSNMMGSYSNGLVFEAGGTYTAEVEHSGYTTACGLFIDYNNDGLFTGPNEVIGVISDPNLNPFVFNFTVPMSITDGKQVAMRVRLQYEDFQGQAAAMNGCNNMTLSGLNIYSEVEDYRATLSVPTLTCNEVSNLQASIGSPANGLNHHLNVTWVGLSGATGYDVEYSTNGGAPWLSAGSTVSNSFNFNAGNNPNAPYWFRVRAKDGSQTCAWTTMTTPRYTAADVPAVPTVNNATQNSLNVTLVAETPVANPAITTYSIIESNTGLFVQANGSLGATELFQTKAQWGSVTVTGLNSATDYCFSAKARNNDGHEVGGLTAVSTAWGTGGVEDFDSYSFVANYCGTQIAQVPWIFCDLGGTNGVWQQTSTNGCSGNAIQYVNATAPNGAGSLMRSAMFNGTGYNSLVVTFDMTNSYSANHTGDRIYMWVQDWAFGGGLYSANISTPTQSVYFDKTRNCQKIQLTFDISGLTFKNNLNIGFWSQTSGTAHSYSVVLDNFKVLDGNAGSCATTTSCTPGTWTGNADDSWANELNWSCLTVPTSTIDVTIPNVTNDPVINVTGPFTEANVRSITIAASASLTIDAPINIFGNYTNNGATVSGSSKIVFKGATSQTIDGDFTIDELELSNSSGLSLNTGSDVNINGKLTLTSGTLNTTNGNMVLKSNNTRTAYVDDFNDITGVTNANTGITGNLTIERYIKTATNFNYQSNYHYVGSIANLNTNAWTDDFVNGGTAPSFTAVTPTTNCSPTNLAAGSAFGNLFRFDETNITDCSLKAWEVMNTGTPLERGRGYAARINDPSVWVGGANRILDETGAYFNAANQGNTVSLSLSRTAANVAIAPLSTTPTRGEHLLSNPYFAPVSWDAIRAASAEVNGTAYRFKPNSGNFEPVNNLSLNKNFSTNEGFVVIPLNNTATSNYTVNIPNTARRAATNNVALRQQPLYAYGMKITVNANNASDEALIVFDNNFSEGYDDGYDARKMMSVTGVPSIFIRDAGTNNDANCILALPEATQVKTIPLGVKIEYNGLHEFTFEGLSDFPNTSIVWLEDLTTGTIQYLKQNNTYSFTANKTDNADRFLLHFAPEMVITATQANCVNENGSISLEERGGLEWSYELVDNNNATVSQNANFSGNQTIAQLPSGTYTLNLNHTASGYQTTETVTIQQVATVTAEMVADNTTVNAGDIVTVDISNTTGATNTTVDMGDGTVYNNESLINHIYTSGGTYTVTLNANNDNCSDAASLQIRVEELTTGISNTDTKGIKVYANANELYVEQLLEKGDIKARVDIYNMLGQIVTSVDITATYQVPTTIILTDVAKGTYIAQVTAGKKTVSKRIVVSE